MNKYPYRKVISAFTFSPALASSIFGLFSGISYLVEGGREFLSAVAIMFIIGVAGSIYFLVPAFVLSIIYVALRLYKKWYSIFFVAMAGGTSAHIWCYFIWWAVENDDLPTLAGSYGIYFLLGALSSSVIACLVLPKKTRVEL